MNAINDRIERLLISLGITAKYTGFFYSMYAVELVASDPSHLILVTKNLYPAVAHRFSSTPSRVERNIRHAAELAWQTNRVMLQNMAGYPLLQRPCASQFIAILSAEYKNLLNREEPNGQQCFF